MTVLGLLAVVVLAVAVLAVAWLFRPPAPAPEPDPDRLLAGLLARRVVVTQTDGTTFVGLLTAADGRSLRLAQAAALSATGDRREVDGELMVPRDQVAYVQLP